MTQRGCWDRVRIGHRYTNAQRLGPQMMNSKGKKKSFCEVLGTDIETIGVGPGIVLYFKLQQYLAILFLVLAIISIAMCVLYAIQSPYGTGFSDILVWTSLGNTVRSWWEGHFSIQKASFAVIPEVVVNVAFCIGLWMIKYRMKTVEERVDDVYLSVGDYSIVVQNVPSDIKEASVLKDHFERWGEVYSVLLCYDCREFGPNQEKIDSSALKLHDAYISDTAKTEDDLLMRHDLYVSPDQRKLDPNLKFDPGCCISTPLRFFGLRTDRVYHFNTMREQGEAREKYENPVNKDTTGFAFVIFQKAKDANKCAAEYSQNQKINLCGQISSLPPEFRLQDGLLRVQDSIEPNDIIFSNLGYSRFSRICREIFTDLIALIIVVAGVVLTWFLNYWKSGTNDFWLTMVISLSTTVLSTVISLAITYVSPFTRPATRTAQSTDMIFRIWFADFCLAALVTYIISIINFEETYYNDDLQIGKTRYFLSFEWYREVGVTLLSNAGIDILKVIGLDGTQIIDRVFHLIPMIFATCMEQDELNHYLAPFNWYIERRMANIIKLMMTALLVSTYQPLIYFLLFVYFFVMFWLDKYNLLFHFEAPPAYSKELTRPFIDTAFFGFHIHGILTIITYVFTMINNHIHETEKYWWIPTLIISVVYVPYMIVRIFFYLKNGFKKGFIGKTHKVRVDETDETGGKPFSRFVTQVQTFYDSHPLYVEPDPNNSVWLPENIKKVLEQSARERKMAEMRMEMLADQEERKKRGEAVDEEQEERALRRKMREMFPRQRGGRGRRRGRNGEDTEGDTAPLITSEYAQPEEKSGEEKEAELQIEMPHFSEVAPDAIDLAPLQNNAYLSYYCIQKLNRPIKKKGTLIPVFRNEAAQRRMERRLQAGRQRADAMQAAQAFNLAVDEKADDQEAEGENTEKVEAVTQERAIVDPNQDASTTSRVEEEPPADNTVPPAVPSGTEYGYENAD
ncbi:hypothetical protein BLNAU_19241 [Blattamonas nauphoetae]|uniref:CSC1/OSCA1-like cytosolic domain-containing protein n=1 Tax=Blattamonas nauphoetae TaxID=2049346 RepID=A0ABQ9X214_9EUKA|nr:hypothetical protein BLNAU_19241 [Blattamonas nauphoetae]